MCIFFLLTERSLKNEHEKDRGQAYARVDEPEFI